MKTSNNIEVPVPSNNEATVVIDSQTHNEEITASSLPHDSNEVPTTDSTGDATAQDSDDNKELPSENENLHEEENAREFWNSLAAFPGKNFVHNIVNAIRNRFHIAANAKLGCLFIYDPKEGRFIEKSRDLFPVWLHDAVSGTDCEERLSSSITNEIFSQLLARARQMTIEDFDKDERYLNVLNGVIDLDSGEFMQHDPKFHFRSVITAKYNNTDSASPVNFLSMLKQVFDTEEDQKRFLESLAYLISSTYSAKKAFVYIGRSNTGKSVILRLITEMIGREFVSNIPLERLSDRFAIHTLCGKKINICGEHESSQSIKKASVFKELIGGDWMDAEPKGVDHYSFRARTKCLFACNKMPEFKSTLMEEALYNRFIFVEFKNPIPEGKRIENFDEILSQEKDGILKLLVDEMIKLRQGGYKFTQTASSDALMEAFKGQKDDIGQFVEDCCELSADSNTPVYRLNEKYDTYCEENCLRKVTPYMFIKGLMETFPTLEKRKAREGKGNPRWCVKGLKIKESNNVA